MRGKNFAAGLLIGLMLCLNAGGAEAKVYNTAASESRTINVEIGENADFLSAQTRVSASFAMAEKCADEHVKPYFSSKGITLSDAEAQAVAFGALELSDVNAGKRANSVYFKASGHVYYDDSLDYVYENKKFINAFIAIKNELADNFRTMGPALAGYAQYKGDDNAEILRAGNTQRQALYQRFVNMQEYFARGARLLVTGSDVNFRSEPNTNCKVLDVLQPDEVLTPAGSSFEAEGRTWYKAVSAKGDVGYVAVDYVKVVC